MCEFMHCRQCIIQGDYTERNLYTTLSLLIIRDTSIILHVLSLLVSTLESLLFSSPLLSKHTKRENPCDDRDADDDDYLSLCLFASHEREILWWWSCLFFFAPSLLPWRPSLLLENASSPWDRLPWRESKVTGVTCHDRRLTVILKSYEHKIRFIIIANHFLSLCMKLLLRVKRIRQS